jgi:short chain dehydrogenase
MSLKNKVAIVTGGNSGIGQAIVLELARQEASIVIDYVVHPEATEMLERQISKLGGQSTGVTADVSKCADLENLVDAAVERFGRLSGVRIPPSAPIQSMCYEESQGKQIRFSNHIAITPAFCETQIVFFCRWSNRQALAARARSASRQQCWFWTAARAERTVHEAGRSGRTATGSSS